jgi:hypothetical protein
VTQRHRGRRDWRLDRGGGRHSGRPTFVRLCTRRGGVHDGVLAVQRGQRRASRRLDGHHHLSGATSEVDGVDDGVARNPCKNLVRLRSRLHNVARLRMITRNYA